jgi:cysteine sulfinate desulfinase/cysteine desulfurase-like protein
VRQHREETQATIRIGIGRFTTYEEIERAAHLIAIAWERLVARGR